MTLGNPIFTSIVRNRIGLDTTSDGHQFFVMIGDSQQKTNEAGGVLPPAISTPGILKDWNGSSLTTVTVDLNNANGGTIGPQFANSYYAASGIKSIIYNGCSSGSSFAKSIDNNNWTLGGDLYNDRISKIDAGLVSFKLTRPTAIFFSLGVNDASDTVSTLGAVLSAIPDLIGRLLAKYPGTPILLSQIGAFDNLSYTQDPGKATRVARVRQALRREVENNANVHFCRSYGALYAETTLWQTNTAHMKQAGLNLTADMLVRWLMNPSYSKWARSIISSHDVELSTTRKNAIQALTAGIGYQNADFIYFYYAPTRVSAKLDWCFMCTPIDGNFSFTAYTSIGTSNTPTYFDTGYNESLYFYKTNIINFYQFSKILTNSTPAGTVGEMMSGSTCVIEQTPSSNINHRTNSAANTTYATDTAFQPNTVYGAGRNNATQQFLIKDGAQVSIGSVAVSALGSATMVQGARNNGSIVNGTNATYAYGAAIKASVNLATVHTEFEACLSAGH